MGDMVNMAKEYKLTPEERETVIRCSASDRQWDIMTADVRIINKLTKRGYKQTADKNPWGYVSFKIDFDRVRFGPAVRQKRPNAFRRTTVEAVSGV